MARNPFADEVDAFGVNRGSADLRHHDFGSDGREAIEKNGVFGVAGNDIVQKFVHVAGGIGMFAVAGLEMTIAKINSRITGGAAGLMAVSLLPI